MSQATDILDYIDRHGSITDEEAARHFHCYRLGARIYDLRQIGIEIITDKVESKRKKGRYYARYRRAV